MTKKDEARKTRTVYTVTSPVHRLDGTVRFQPGDLLDEKHDVVTDSPNQVRRTVLEYVGDDPTVVPPGHDLPEGTAVREPSDPHPGSTLRTEPAVGQEQDDSPTVRQGKSEATR